MNKQSALQHWYGIKEWMRLSNALQVGENKLMETSWKPTWHNV